MLLRSALGAVLALLVCAGSAQASSLVFIKDYNVWLANADGTGQRPVTTDGFTAAPYEYPSQADDGTILAARGTRFVKLDRQGNRCRRQARRAARLRRRDDPLLRPAR